MHYLLLGMAIVLEVTGTSLLEYSEGFTKILPTICSICLYICSLLCLSRALLKIDLGIAYATWCSVGIICTSIIAYVVFHQKLSTAGIVGITLIICGCVIVNLFGTVR